MSASNHETVLTEGTGEARLNRPFKTPLDEMGATALAWYKLKWSFGYRLIGPDAWTRKFRKRLAYEKWTFSHVSGRFGLIRWRMGIHLPFKASISGVEYLVRNGTERREFSRKMREAQNPMPFREEVLDTGSGVFRFSYKGKDLAFPFEGNRYGTFVVLKEFFIREPFADLDIEGVDVIDIGSSIGDTPIYFALRGARRVIALEPYPIAYARAKANISKNGFDDKIVLLNEGAGRTGIMRLSRSETNLWANAAPSKDGEDIRFNSLRDIIERFGIGKAALKVHGEGAEYELLEDASSEDLAHFPQIVLKYHYGATKIIKKLRSSGYTIERKWDLHFSYNRSSSSPKYEAGFIFAKSISA